jgi:hypothetical protein
MTISNSTTMKPLAKPSGDMASSGRANASGVSGNQMSKQGFGAHSAMSGSMAVGVPVAVVGTAALVLPVIQNRDQFLPNSNKTGTSPFSNWLAEKSDNDIPTPLTVKQRAQHVAEAALFVGSVLALRRVPAAHSRLHSSLISTDWKEWAKVGLGIAAIGQVNQAINWKPPLWLQSMINVMVVGPLATGFTKRNMIQAAILAPIVAGMAQTTQTLSEKSEKPFQQVFHIPPAVTHALFSVGMMMAGLRIFPWVNNAIPVSASGAGSASARTGMISTCANGCCSSLVCVNDVGQLGTSLVRSIRKIDHDKRTAERNGAVTS